MKIKISSVPEKTEIYEHLLLAMLKETIWWFMIRRMKIVEKELIQFVVIDDSIVRGTIRKKYFDDVGQISRKKKL
jgi:hypothetical protein